MDLEGASVKIVISSCHAYRDTWGPVLACMTRMWPDRPHGWTPVLAIDQAKDVSPWTVESVTQAGPGAQFADTIRCALREEKDEEVTLLLQDDFFLAAPVDTAYVESALGRMRREQAIACWRLMPCPGPDFPMEDDSDTGEIAPGAPYRVSCQAALWRIGVLRKIMARTSTASDFELQGTRIARSYSDRFLSVRRERRPIPVDYPVTGILRGRWNPDALALFRRLEIAVNLSLRAIESH